MSEFNVGDKVRFHSRPLRDGLYPNSRLNFYRDFGPDAIYEVRGLREPNGLCPKGVLIITSLKTPRGDTDRVGLSTERFEKIETDISKMSVRELSRLIRGE